MENVWKEAFAVGTEWDQYDSVYDISWDFSNLDDALEEGGLLHGKKVYLFGCTEQQLGIKSVQMEKESIVPMREMKMGWVPVVPEGGGNTSVEKTAKQSKVFALKCTQRRAGLRQLREERVKKYEYCLPYVYLPHMQEEEQPDTVINIMYTFDGETTPPLVAEYDWEMDDLEEFTDALVEEEQLPAAEKDKFKEYLKGEVKAAKLKIREEKEKRRKISDEMSEEKKAAYRDMKFYKFYPKKSDKAPDTSSVQSKYINRYYGKAHEIL